jgi:tetratricopeptide (TPR) repeat protein
MPTTKALALLLAVLLPQDPAPTVQALLAEARGELAAGRLDAARTAVDRAAMRDARHLAVLETSASIADAAGDLDRAAHDRFLWIELHDGRPRAQQDRRARKAVLETLLAADPEAQAWEKLQKRYVAGLVGLAKEYEKDADLLGAIDLWAHVLEVDPTRVDAQAAIAQIRRTGGAEVAVEDLFAGAGDPTDGLSAEEQRALDAAHATWENAYTKETDNYRYRTDAGKLVLETSAIAMEQMNRFYRRFFRFKEDGGKTPQIEIRIFRSRDEYLELGSNPVEWSGGQFTGSAVETYVGGVTGKEGLRDMYRTLFHEAGHQFVSLTGPFVPGWLNEAYASFFEGCTILSNGSVRWNQPPPGRLFPLAQRMERGWMESTAEADGADADPERAPPFRMVVEGRYAWGPPWYAPTWGLVYFLYNHRDAEGRAVWRDALHAYYQSFKRGRAEDPVLHFEETVLTAPLSPVRRIDELDPLWKAFVLELRDRETGKSDGGTRLLAWADAALGRGEKDLALEFLLEARDELGADPDLLWKTAELLQDLDRRPRAAATYREFKRELELRGRHEDPRYEDAKQRIRRLDSNVVRYEALKQKVGVDGLALARGYEERGLPTMALEIARRMSARYSMPEALEFYVALAERTGRSLARWSLAYDERSLDGWSGDEDAYQAYGARIRAEVRADGGTMVTKLLTADVVFDGDFSLEAELRIPFDGGEPAGRLAGLCFGRKGDQDYHAVLLHPNGFLDVSTNRGGTWEIRDHRQVPAGAGDWHRLRIDVAGESVDVYLDGLYVRSLDYPNARVLRGGFGLITGPGSAEYREIRLLARDPHDPAARIERRMAMERVLADAGLRQEGSFSGIEPPELEVRWQRGEPTRLAELRGRPVMLVFWSPAAEKVIPTARYIAHLTSRGEAADLQTIVICDGGTGAAALRDALATEAMAGARIAIDAGPTFERYFVKAGGFGMPRFLLLGRSGRVVFEGDPGFRSGVGWREADGATYVDQAFAELLEDR